MNYKKKIELAEFVLNEFCKGKSENNTVELLKDQKISNSNINSILFSSKNLFIDRFGDKILLNMDEEGNLLMIDELENTDQKWNEKFYDHAYIKLKERELGKIENSILSSETLDQDLNNTRNKFISKEEILNKKKEYDANETNRIVSAYLGIILGVACFCWFMFKVFNGGGKIYFLMLAVIFFVRGVYDLNNKIKP